LSQSIPSSVKPNSIGQKFSGSKDRFFMPRNRTTDPAPDQYMPKTNMKDESVLATSARAVVGQNTFSILNQKFHKRELD